MLLIPNAAIPVGARHITGFCLFSCKARFCNSAEIALMRNDFPVPAVPSILIWSGSGWSFLPCSALSVALYHAITCKNTSLCSPWKSCQSTPGGWLAGAPPILFCVSNQSQAIEISSSVQSDWVQGYCSSMSCWPRRLMFPPTGALGAWPASAIHASWKRLSLSLPSIDSVSDSGSSSSTSGSGSGLSWWWGWQVCLQCW